MGPNARARAIAAALVAFFAAERVVIVGPSLKNRVSVSAEGQVQWGQPVGDRPVSLQQAQTHEYVTGTFLLAGSEMLKLKK